MQNAESMYKISESKYGANAPEQKQLTFDRISETRHSDSERISKAANLTGMSKTVYDALIDDGFTSIDELAAQTGIADSKLNTVLTLLEVKGLIKKTEGERYSKV